MNTVNVYIKGQEDKELISFCDIFPSRIKNIGMDAVFDRQIVYDYKEWPQPPGGGQMRGKVPRKEVWS